jgi:hypothetical protein
MGYSSGGYSRSLAFRDWVNTPRDKRKVTKFGALKFEGDGVWSYRRQIAKIFDDEKIILVDEDSRGGVSRTTTTHGYAISAATLSPTWSVVEVPPSLLHRDLTEVVTQLWAKPRFKDMRQVFMFYRLASDQEYSSLARTPLGKMRSGTQIREDIKKRVIEFVKSNQTNRDAMQAIFEMAKEANSH